MLPIGQDTHAAQNAVRELVEMIEDDFVWHRDDRDKGGGKRRVLIGVEVTDTSASLLLDFDCRTPSSGRTYSFLEKLQNLHSGTGARHEGLGRVLPNMAAGVRLVAAPVADKMTKLSVTNK
jgi:hypothetical protein